MPDAGAEPPLSRCDEAIRFSRYADGVLVLALSTPGNATTAAIAGVALLLGVLLMARGRRLDAGPGAAVASPPPEAPAVAAQPSSVQHDPEPAPQQPAPPDPEAAEPATVAVDGAAAEPQRIRLRGARFGETAGQGPASEEAEPAPAAEPAQTAPTAPNEDEPAPTAPTEDEPARPRRIRLGGARFGPAAPEKPPATPEPPAAPEPADTAPEPADAAPEATAAPEAPEPTEPPATPHPSAMPAGPAVEPAWTLRARRPEGTAAKPGRIRLGERRFLPATPEPADTAPEPADAAPADAAPPEPAAPPGLPPASKFRQGSIRLRE